MCMWCEMCVCMWCEMCVCFKGEMQSNMSVSVQINKSFVTDITCMVGIQEYTHTHTTHTHTHTHTHTQVPHISVNLLCCTYCTKQDGVLRTVIILFLEVSHYSHFSKTHISMQFAMKENFFNYSLKLKSVF